MKKRLFILIIVFTSNLIMAQQSFTLKQAVDFALKNNKKVKNADLAIEAAKWKKWETISTGLPQVNGKIEYDYSIRPDELTNNPTPDNPFLFFFPKHKLTPSITLTQLIFDGAYLVGLQSAKVFLDITKNAKLKTDNEITKAVTSAYTNVLLTAKSMDIMDNNIQTLEKNLYDTRLIFENGLTEEEDIEQLEITLNDLQNNKSNLISIHNHAIDFLKILMGIEQDKNISASDQLDNLTLSIKQSENKIVFSALNNIDYKIAENDLKTKSLLYKLERARALPTISGFANLNYLGQSAPPDDSFDFFSKEQEWLGFGTLGLKMDIPIFTSYQGGARRKKAKLEWQASQNSFEETKLEIDLNIKNIATQLELAQNTLVNRKKNLALAERIENKNNIKFKEGIASSFELRQAQLQLYTSQQEYLKAMVDVINKKAELESLTK